jgi:hypothetical protein
MTKEYEVTPEMIEAGLSACYAEFLSWESASTSEIRAALARAFVAMIKMRSVNPSE